MVAVKVQSLKDIIRAYLQNLGFSGQKLEAAVEDVAACAGDYYDGGSIVDFLDALPVSHMRRQRKFAGMPDYQIAALFKLVFIENDGAGRWGTLPWCQKELPTEMLALTERYAADMLPAYKASRMEAQPIESLRPVRWFTRLFRRRKHHEAA